MPTHTRTIYVLSHFSRLRPRGRYPQETFPPIVFSHLPLGRRRREKSPGDLSRPEKMTTMPARPRRRCPRPGCQWPQPCPDHHRKTETRSDYADLYESKEWRELKAETLDEERYCPGYHRDGNPIPCGRPTTQVDHVIALADGGPPLERSNTRALCASCHGRKTGDEVRARRARAREQEGKGVAN